MSLRSGRLEMTVKEVTENEPTRSVIHPGTCAGRSLLSTGDSRGFDPKAPVARCLICGMDFTTRLALIWHDCKNHPDRNFYRKGAGW